MHKLWNQSSVTPPACVWKPNGSSFSPGPHAGEQPSFLVYPCGVSRPGKSRSYRHCISISSGLV